MTTRIPAALLATLLVSVPAVHAATAHLIVVDRQAARGTTRISYRAPGPLAGLPVGAGPDDVAAGMTVRVDAASAGWSMPAGGWDGTSGWRRNDADGAAFSNAAAPGGPTGVRTASVRPSSGIRVAARTLGDAGTALHVAAAPARAVDVMFSVTATAGTVQRCVHFPATACRFRALDGGAGAKLACTDGIADPSCVSFSSSGSGFLCSEILGFSQSLMWHETPEFQQEIVDARWQMRFRAGGALDVWADPSSDVWSAPVSTDCLGVGSPVLCTPCTSASNAPDRVVLTITLDTYESNVQVWVQDIRAAIATIRLKHPGVRQIMLQPVVGGPHHQICPWPGVPLGVRASYNHPYADQAIALVVPDAPDLVAGPSPEVGSCADYADDIGHLVPAARGPIGLAIGEYYASVP